MWEEGPRTGSADCWELREVVDEAAAEVGGILLSGSVTSGLEETRERRCFTLADLDRLCLPHCQSLRELRIPGPWIKRAEPLLCGGVAGIIHGHGSYLPVHFWCFGVSGAGRIAGMRREVRVELAMKAGAQQIQNGVHSVFVWHI